MDQKFELSTEYQPTGDQPNAIKLVSGLRKGTKEQVFIRCDRIKTFTMANIVQQMQRPTLVLAHNKTLAAQLYNEFKNFFQ